MKRQSLFSDEIKKHNIKYYLLKYLPNMQSVQRNPKVHFRALYLIYSVWIKWYFKNEYNRLKDQAIDTPIDNSCLLKQCNSINTPLNSHWICISWIHITYSIFKGAGYNLWIV